MYNLRLALLNELEHLVSLDNETNLTAWSYNDYYNSYLNENNYIYVLELEQKIYACCVLGKLVYDVEILQLWVNKNYKGCGIGDIFLKRIIQLLQRNFFIDTIFLELRENNLVARALYLRNGFQIIGNRKNYYKIDNVYINAVLMMKNLKGSCIG